MPPQVQGSLSPQSRSKVSSSTFIRVCGCHCLYGKLLGSNNNRDSQPGCCSTRGLGFRGYCESARLERETGIVYEGLGCLTMPAQPPLQRLLRHPYRGSKMISKVVFGRLDRIQPKERLHIKSFLPCPHAARVYKARFEPPSPGPTNCI